MDSLRNSIIKVQVKMKDAKDKGKIHKRREKFQIASIEFD